MEHYVIFQKTRLTYQPSCQKANSLIFINNGWFFGLSLKFTMASDGLSWKHQIGNITLRISKTVEMFAKRKQFAPCNTLLRIYQSLILTRMDISYGLTAMGLVDKSFLTFSLLKKTSQIDIFNRKKWSCCSFVYWLWYCTRKLSLFRNQLVVLTVLYMTYVTKRHPMTFKTCSSTLTAFTLIGKLRNHNGDAEDNVD